MHSSPFQVLLLFCFPRHSPPVGTVREAVKVLADHNILSAPVVNVAAPADAPWNERYAGVVDMMDVVLFLQRLTEGKYDGRPRYMPRYPAAVAAVVVVAAAVVVVVVVVLLSSSALPHLCRLVILIVVVIVSLWSWFWLWLRLWFWFWFWLVVVVVLWLWLWLWWFQW